MYCLYWLRYMYIVCIVFCLIVYTESLSFFNLNAEKSLKNRKLPVTIYSDSPGFNILLPLLDHPTHIYIIFQTMRVGSYIMLFLLILQCDFLRTRILLVIKLRKLLIKCFCLSTFQFYQLS